ncbi:MAG: hypothetical protein J5535_05035 [Firmicutes bacterium]|nr:hypothetical protein [Bacillota bacterium]
MLSKETNDLGVITLNEALVSQLLAEAISPWEGKAKYTGERQIRCGEDGLYVYAALSIRIGCSIKEIAGGILDYMIKAAVESLELPVEDIVIEVVQMTTLRNSVKRSIVYSYRGTEDEQQE